jgi:hypothetical protein
MDFIERIFHISPDGGSGFIEFMLVLAFSAASILPVVGKAVRRK